jgi:predicted enzyme related to lactoylglutathione lyase
MHIKFAALPVSEQDRAIAFYTDNFDCTVAMDQPYGDDGWRWVAISFGGAQTQLQFERRDGDGESDTPSLVFVDSDLARTVESLRANGVKIITEPQRAPWDHKETYAEFRDSEGNRVVITS